MASVNKREWTYKGVTKTAWVVRYLDTGGDRRMKTFDKKKDADTFRTKVESGAHHDNKLTTKAITFSDALDIWLREIDRRHAIGELSGNYRFSMTRMVEAYVRPSLGGFKLHELSRDHVQHWLDTVILTYSKETVKHMLIPVHGAVRLAVRRKLIARNPMADDPVRVGDKPRVYRHIPTKDQITDLLRFISARRPNQSELSWRRGLLIFTLGLFQGLRIGEICGLQWDDIDFENGVIRIKHSLSRFDGLKRPKTAAGIRNLPLSKPSLELLLQIKASTKYGPATGYVYRCNRGSPVKPDDARRHTFYRVMKAAGYTVDGSRSKVLFNIHSLRHAALSLLAEKGIPALHLKQLAGHKSVQTTMDIYGHLFPCDTTDRRIMGDVADQFGARALLPPQQGCDNAT